LRGTRVGAERLEEAAGMLSHDIVQSRTRHGYRRDVMRGFLVRGLINAAKRGGADPQALSPALEAAYV
jgi:hypothetical protein